MKVVATGAAVEAKDSMCRVHQEMCRVHQEIQDLYDASPEDIEGIVDILVSCDGTWQKCGFSSFFEEAFIVAYETGKVMDFIVLSKHCSGCKRWRTMTRSQWNIKTGNGNMCDPSTLQAVLVQWNHLEHWKFSSALLGTS
jgi:hypothetical protein